MPRPPHEHPLYRLSSIGRPLDPRFATNKAMMVFVPLALIAGIVYDAIVHGLRWQALFTGGSAALTVFLSWALGRELDPDRNATAFVALALAGAAWVLADGRDPWPLLVALGTVRVVNRTVGPPARITDGIGVVAALAVAVFIFRRWSLAVIGAAAFALDGVLIDRRPRAWIFALASVALFAVAWHLGIVRTVTPRQPGLVGAIVSAYLLVAMSLPPLQSPCDLPSFTLDRTRVQAGMLLAAMIAMLAQLEGGRPYPAATLLAVLVAVVVGRVIALARTLTGKPRRDSAS